MATKWFFEADYLQACNCDYGCPCEFEAPPTQGNCQGVGVWRIGHGKFGDLPLDGLHLGFAAHWPRAIHQGNGTAALLFDEKASPEQRDALVRISTGQEGGMPFEIIVTTVSTVLPFQYLLFEFHLDGKRSSARAGDVAKIRVEPIKNPVTKQEEGVKIVHETGFIFQSADVVSGAVCEANMDGLKFSWPNKAAFVAHVRYGN